MPNGTAVVDRPRPMAAPTVSGEPAHMTGLYEEWIKQRHMRVLIQTQRAPRRSGGRGFFGRLRPLVPPLAQPCL